MLLEDIMKVTHTRGGYPVLSIRNYPENDSGSQLLVDVLTDGHVETEPYYANGSYFKDQDSLMDLVTNKKVEPHQEVKPKGESIELLETISSMIDVYLQDSTLGESKDI